MPRLRGMTAVLALIVAAGVAVWFWLRPAPPPAPPVPQGDDAAIARVLGEARDAVVAEPRAAEAWGQLGIAFYAHQYAAQARRCLEQAELIDAADARWPYVLGILALKDRQPEEAIRCFERAAQREPAHPTAVRLRLAETLLEAGRFAQADSIYRELAETFRQNPRIELGIALLATRIELGLARLAVERGDLKEGAARALRCSQTPLTQKAASALLAEAHQRLGDADLARRHGRRAARLPSDLPWPDPILRECDRYAAGLHAGLDKADQLARQGRHKEAVALLRDLVEHYPRSERAWASLALALLQMRNPAQAEDAARHGLQVNPDFLQGYLILGTILFEQGKTAAAIDVFEEALKKERTFAMAHYNLGHCWLKAGDLERAADAFGQAVRHRPNYREALGQLGLVELRRGRWPHAVASLAQAADLEADTDDQAFTWHLARVLALRHW